MCRYSKNIVEFLKRFDSFPYQDYAPKIKKYILRAVENGDVLQTKGKGASGRFTLPGLKARKSKKKNYKKLGKKFDEDEVEYEPGKSARDEAKEKSEMELAEHRARLEEEAERKAAEKEMKPKKPRPEPKTDWVVIMVKGMKIAQEKTWYQVTNTNLLAKVHPIICFSSGEVGGLAQAYLGT